MNVMRKSSIHKERIVKPSPPRFFGFLLALWFFCRLCYVAHNGTLYRNGSDHGRRAGVILRVLLTIMSKWNRGLSRLAIYTVNRLFS